MRPGGNGGWLRPQLPALTARKLSVYGALFSPGTHPHGEGEGADLRSHLSRTAREIPARDTAECRVCASCGQSLPLAEFRPNARLRDGFDSWCRECHRAATRRWRARNRERENARRRVGPFPERPCAVCGVTFRPVRLAGVYCSPKCRRKTATNDVYEDRSAAA